MKCERCGATLILDPSDRMDDYYCPKECSQVIDRENRMKEEAQKSPEQRSAESEDAIAAYIKELYDTQILKQTYCWVLNCPRSEAMTLKTGKNPGPFTRTPENSDEQYGHFCPDCGKSLRYHHFFGKNKIYDRGNPQCVNAWGALTKQEKAQVYARYKAPILK